MLIQQTMTKGEGGKPVASQDEKKPSTVSSVRVIKKASENDVGTVVRPTSDGTSYTETKE